MKNDLLRLLGKSFTAVTADPLVKAFQTKPKTEKVDDRYYLIFRSAGISFDSERDRNVRSIFLRNDGVEGYKGYVGTLPDGLKFEDSRRSVRKKLGKPTQTGGGEMIKGIGKVAPWDLYDKSSYWLHVEYAEDEESIGLITIMTPDAVP